MVMDPACRKAIDTLGGPSALSRKLGIVPSANTQSAPETAHWVPKIAELSGIPPQELRPDIYDMTAIR